MIYIKAFNQVVSSRKDAKKLLGGTNAYNRALKNKYSLEEFAEKARYNFI